MTTAEVISEELGNDGSRWVTAHDFLLESWKRERLAHKETKDERDRLESALRLAESALQSRRAS